MKRGPENRGQLSNFAKVAAGAGALAAAVYLDGQAGKRTWPSTPTRLVGLPPDARTATIAFPGMGSLDGKDHAGQLAKILPGHTAHFDYSSDGFSTGQLAVQLVQQAGALEVVHIGGHSMGGPTGLETVRKARNASGQDIKLGTVALFCSPFDITDGQKGEFAHLMQAVKWPLGPGNKFVFQLLRSIALEKKSLGEATRQAKIDATAGGSPRLWLSQLGGLGKTNLWKHADDYSQMVGEETKIVYCRPEDPARDVAVSTLGASQKYAKFCAEIGAPFEEHLIPDTGHADVGAACSYILALSGAALAP